MTETKSRPSEFFWTWAPAIIPGVIMSVLFGLMFSAPFQNSFNASRCISQYGESWFALIVPVLMELPGGIITYTKVRKNSGAWLWVLTVIAIELIVTITIFLFCVMPLYSYLEFPDSFNGEPRYYFGETMGDTAVGQGRLFDKEKHLVYRGSFDNNMYEGKGREYAYGKEYTFKKEWWEEDDLLYKGDFSKGRFHGQGTYYGTSSKTVGTFREGLSTGYMEHWYLDNETGEILLYKGSYWRGLAYGPGTTLREDGSIYRDGWYENGSYYGPEPPDPGGAPDNSGPGHQITPD